VLDLCESDGSALAFGPGFAPYDSFERTSKPPTHYPHPVWKRLTLAVHMKHIPDYHYQHNNIPKSRRESGIATANLSKTYLQAFIIPKPPVQSNSRQDGGG
jgi:hypothetical protein